MRTIVNRQTSMKENGQVCAIDEGQVPEGRGEYIWTLVNTFCPWRRPLGVNLERTEMDHKATVNKIIEHKQIDFYPVVTYRLAINT